MDSSSKKKMETPTSNNLLYSFDFNAIEEMNPSLSK